MVCTNVDSVLFVVDMLFLSADGKDDIDLASGSSVDAFEAGTPVELTKGR